MSKERLVQDFTGALYKNGHVDRPKFCARCNLSTRPPCSVCGHSLSGEINDNKTTCEVCGKMHTIRIKK